VPAYASRVRRLVDALGLQEFSSASTIGLQGATPQDTAGVAVPTGAPRDGPAPLSGFGGGFLVSWGAEREDRGRGDGGEGPGARPGARGEETAVCQAQILNRSLILNRPICWGFT
jgi:hypothetical protein